MVFGDPHYKTLDGVHYNYHGLGEFILLKSRDNHLRVHVRQERLSNNSRVAMVNAVAIRLGKDVIKYSSKQGIRSKKKRVRLNGKKIKSKRRKIKLQHGTLYQAPRHYLLETHTGERIYWDRVGEYMNVKIRVCDPSSFTGLLAPNINTHLAEYQGQRPSRKKRKSLYSKQAPHYFIKSKKRRMLLITGESNPHPPAKAPKRQVSRDRARKLCEMQKLTGALMDACIFDVSVTGKAKFARNISKLGHDTIRMVKKYALSKMSKKQWRRTLRKKIPFVTQFQKNILNKIR